MHGPTDHAGPLTRTPPGPPRTDPTLHPGELIHGDYTNPLDLPAEHFDLLMSLYAGFISEHCTQHLKIGGTLLVNPSHGDAAMASIEARYVLSGIVKSGSGTHRVDIKGLDSYLTSKKQQAITRASLHRTGRGIGYTKPPFAYLFTRAQ
jgi:hypothetical protein